MKKVIWIVVGVAIAGVLGWQIWQRISEAHGPTKRQRPPLPVEVSPVQTADVRDVGVFPGTLLPKSQFLVRPKIGGRLARLLVHIGDPVTQGQLVAEIDDEEYAQDFKQVDAELDVALANVEQCVTSLELARRELTRIQELRKKQMASEAELDTAEAQSSAADARRKVAEAQVKQKRAALEAARLRLDYAKVRATWATEGSAGAEADTRPATRPPGAPVTTGPAVTRPATGPAAEPRVIGERFVDEGALLKANDPIVSVLEDRRMTAVIYAIERDYPKLKLGQAAMVVTDAHPDERFGGQIVRIAPLLKETSRQARVEIEIPNPKRQLRSGMFLRVSIEFGRSLGATVVPFGAIVKRDDVEGVFVPDAQAAKARFVPVTVGIIEGQLAQIVRPKLTGQVITLGQHLLEKDSPIMLPKPEPQAAGGAGPASAPANRPTGERP